MTKAKHKAINKSINLITEYYLLLRRLIVSTVLTTIVCYNN